jgi:HSP20 family protein
MASKVTKTETGSAMTPRAHPLMTLRDEVDRLFDNFFPTAFGRSLFDLDPWRERPLHSLGDIAPHMDVKECADRYDITVEVPGMDDKDVTVTVANGMLTVSGEKRVERTDESGEMHLTERSYGAFTRAVRLPENTDAEGIKADYAKGVLTITVPKRHGREGEKKIQVTTH